MMTTQTLFDVAFFLGKNDNRPECCQISLEKLLDGLSKFKTRTDKDGRLWSPTRYKKNSDRRSNDAVEALTCFVLDMDGGFDPHDFLDAWKEWTYVVHSTFQSTKECPKWRAVFPLAAAVPAAEWEKVYAKLSCTLSANLVDPACKDLARMYYTPSCPPEREGERFVYKNMGRLLDPAEIPDLPEPDHERIPESRSYSGKILPGVDYSEKTRWEDILEPAGWQIFRENYRGQTLWVRPGKKKSQGCSAKTGPGPNGDRFYAWSSEAGVPHGKALDKFALYAFLYHNGDFPAAADKLRSNGYGGQQTEPPSVVSEIREGELRRFNLTDLGNAERFVAIHGSNLRYCHLWGRWLFWDGRRWEIDETGGTRVYELAYLMVRQMQKEAADSTDEDLRKSLGPWAHKCETRSRIENIVAMARTFPRLNVTPAQLDRHPDWLNLANGTYDTKTGELRPHSKDDLLTRLIDIPYSDSADCPKFRAFLKQVLSDDLPLVQYVVKALGYSITGCTQEQCFFFLHGTQGNNGKSTFVETILRIVGDYGCQTPTETLMARKDPGISNDIARLKEARFVAAPETEQGSRLNEGLVKRLTGGDTITARYMHQEFFEFKPQFKIWMSGNHRPNIRGTDDAIWRRVVPIPFQVVIPPEERNPELQEEFWAEREGILGLLIDGCKVWRRDRLARPESITKEAGEYREEMDVLGSFLDECTIVDVGAVVKSSELYERYVNWTKRNGEFQLSQKNFGQAMQGRGEGSRRTMHGYIYERRRLVEEENTDHVYRGSKD